jgi:streptomycin 6-kinase
MPSATRSAPNAVGQEDEAARELHADPAGLARRMADLLGLDPVRLRRWLFARCVQEAPGWPPPAAVARRLRID